MVPGLLDPEVPMPKLSDTQSILLAAAARRAGTDRNRKPDVVVWPVELTELRELLNAT